MRVDPLLAPRLAPASPGAVTMVAAGEPGEPLETGAGAGAGTGAEAVGDWEEAGPSWIAWAFPASRPSGSLKVKTLFCGRYFEFV